MEEYERRFTNPVLIWGSGLVLGVLFGLIILGWWLFPVVWVDASPADLLYDYQVETLRTTIEAYGYNSDTAVAKIRYDSLGENREMALAQIVQNPGSLPPTLVASFSQEVAGVPVNQLATQPIEEPKTTTGLRTGVAIIGAILFLLVGGLLTYLILRGREQKEEAAIPAEPAMVIEAPVEEEPVEEYAAPVALGAAAVSAEASDENAGMQAAEAETAQETREEVSPDRMDLPPFLATAGAAAAIYGLAKDDSSVEEVPVGAAIGEEIPEDVLLPDAELEEFPFEELPSEEATEMLPSEEIEIGDAGLELGDTDMALGGAGTAFAATALAASELFGEEEPAAPTEPEATEIAAEAPAGEQIIDETEQVVNAHDPVEIKMRKRLDYVEGIGPIYAGKLAEIGIETTGKLLVDGVSRKGRKDIAEKSDISERLILKWVNHVDLYRIKGVGSEYADLLESAGVDTIPELAQRRPDHLYQAMAAVNEEKSLVRQLPTEEHVADWIEQAKELPRIIQY